MSIKGNRFNFASEDGDVPGWVLITLMTAGLPVYNQNRVIGVSRFTTQTAAELPKDSKPMTCQLCHDDYAALHAYKGGETWLWVCAWCEPRIETENPDEQDSPG
jgi:hypothetical protein